MSYSEQPKKHEVQGGSKWTLISGVANFRLEESNTEIRQHYLEISVFLPEERIDIPNRSPPSERSRNLKQPAR